MTTNIELNNPATLALLDTAFGDDDEEVVQPTLEEHPFLKWMTGNLITTNRTVAVGWHVRFGVNPQLDRVLTAMGVQQHVVQHKTGDEPLVPYWNLSGGGRTWSLIVISTGVKSPWEMKKDPNDRCGIAYGVGNIWDKEGKIVYKEGTDQPKQKPQMQLRVFVHELLGSEEQPNEGFNEWFMVSVSNYMVDHLYKMLNAQYPVLSAYDACIAALQKGKPTQNDVPQKPIRAKYWGFSIPTAIGTETEVGPNKDHRSTIIPMAALVPQLRLDSPDTITYLNTHRTPLHIQKRLIEDGLLAETYVWSGERSNEIINGKQQQGTLVTEEEPLEVVALTLPQLPAAPDPQVSEEQITWIATMYCGNHTDTIQKVCKHFQVSDLAHLRTSQYQLLFDQLKQ